MITSITNASICSSSLKETFETHTGAKLNLKLKAFEKNGRGALNERVCSQILFPLLFLPTAASLLQIGDRLAHFPSLFALALRNSDVFVPLDHCDYLTH